MTCQKGHTETARVLLEGGATVDHADDEGWTALLIACLAGHTETARVLLEGGATVDQADQYGATPLLIACEKGHPRIVKLLVERGADVTLSNKEGETAMDYTENAAIKEMLRQHECKNQSDESGVQAVCTISYLQQNLAL